MNAAVATVPAPAATPAPAGAPAFPFLLLYLALIYLRPHEYKSVTIELPLHTFALFVAFIAWLPAKGKDFSAPQFRVLPLLYVIMAVSITVNGWAGGAAVVASVFLPQLVLFLVMATTLTTVERHGKAMLVVALSTVVMAVHGIDQSMNYVGWSGARLSQETRITYTGIFSDPNDLAIAFLLGLSFAGYRFGAARAVPGKAFWLACMGVLAYGIFLTNSRGGMLAAAFQAFLYVLLRHGAVKAGAFGLVGVIGLMMLPSRLDSLNAGEESAAGRIESWDIGFQLLKQFPILGVGYNRFGDYHILTAHNSFVLAFSELGLVGYFFWLAFVVATVMQAYRLMRLAPESIGVESPQERAELARYTAVAWAYFYAVAGFLVAAFFLSRTYNILLVTLGASCVAIDATFRRRWPTLPRIPFGRVARIAVAVEVASIVFIYVFVRMTL